MGSTRTTAALTTALLGMALVPAAAQASPGWKADGPVALPSGVSFQDVAASPLSGVIVVVGQSSAGQGVIYRRVGGSWTATSDTITLPADASPTAPDVHIDRVALANGNPPGAAWAIGTYRDAAGAEKPLLLRATGGLGSISAATWQPPSGSLPDGEVATAVAIRGTDGMIGTASGKIYPFHDATGALDAAVQPPQPQVAGRIDAIAIYADGKAFTAGTGSGGATNRIFAVDLTTVPSTPTMLAVASSEPATVDLAGVGAVSDSVATAIEGPAAGHTPGLWSPGTGGVWARSTPAGFDNASAPGDLSLVDTGTTIVQAASGSQGGSGAVWRRNQSGVGWTLDTSFPDGTPLSASALSGVAALAPVDIWAVGDGGTVVHYTQLPDPLPEVSIDSPPEGASTPDPAVKFFFSSDPSVIEFRCGVDDPDPTGFAPCTSGRTVNFSSVGSHTFYVRARNANGYGGTASRTVTIQPPDTSIDSGPAGTIFSTSASFGFSSNLSSAKFQCSLDGAAFAACGSPRTLSGLGEGQHSFRVRAVSSAGADPTPASRTFTVKLAKGPCTQVPRPLVRNVTVARRPGMLLIGFDLAADSRVKAKAYHGGKTIGRIKPRVLRQGHHQLKLHYRGRGKPTSLKLLASPADGNACK